SRGEDPGRDRCHHHGPGGPGQPGEARHRGPAPRRRPAGRTCFCPCTGRTPTRGRGSRDDAEVKALGSFPSGHTEAEGLAPGQTAPVGDRVYDVEAGRANGLRVVGVTWGYGCPEELAGADSPGQLPDL